MMQRENSLVGACAQVLKQGIALLEQLDDHRYTATSGWPVQSGPSAFTTTVPLAASASLPAGSGATYCSAPVVQS